MASQVFLDNHTFFRAVSSERESLDKRLLSAQRSEMTGVQKVTHGPVSDRLSLHHEGHQSLSAT
jgi:hypothetical protein